MLRAERVARLVSIMLLAGLLHSCGGYEAPPPLAPSPVTPTVVRIEILGPRAVAPAESVQLRVVGHMSDGSTKSDLGQVQWRSQQRDIASIDGAGLVTGGQRGETVINVVAGGKTASTEFIVIPPGTFKLSVIVREGPTLALDVRVEVVAGVGTGQFDLTSVGGRYDLYGVSGTTDLRISGNGYRERIERVVVTENTVVTLEVVPLRDRVDVSGNYTLAIDGDPACQAALPQGLGSRRYGAVVSQSGPNVSVSLSGANFRLNGVTRNTFLGRIDGQNQNIVFNLGDAGDAYYYYDPKPDVIEELGDGYFLYFRGGAVTSISGRSLSGTFTGRIEQLLYRGPFNYTRVASCSSRQVSFVLSR